MVRVADLDASIAFFALLGLEETRRWDNEAGRFTLVFMAPPGQPECPVELTYNWDGDEGLPSDSRHFGHLAYEVKGYLCHMPASDGQWHHNQSPAARRPHGFCPQPRQYLN
jgi:catechol 2,3-dioxygenase-like lactoylglutathione lyase family enzyme